MSGNSTALSQPSVREHEIQEEDAAPPLNADTVVGTTPTCLERHVNIVSRQELQSCPCWQRAFASQHKDRRYYEIVEDTIHPEFDYWYFAIRDHQGEIQAVQPFFVLDQDILAGVHPQFSRLTRAIRLQWPRFFEDRRSIELPGRGLKLAGIHTLIAFPFRRHARISMTAFPPCATATGRFARSYTGISGSIPSKW